MALSPRSGRHMQCRGTPIAIWTGQSSPLRVDALSQKYASVPRSGPLYSVHTPLATGRLGGGSETTNCPKQRGISRSGRTGKGGGTTDRLPLGPLQHAAPASAACRGGVDVGGVAGLLEKEGWSLEAGGRRTSTLGPDSAAPLRNAHGGSGKDQASFIDGARPLSGRILRDARATGPMPSPEPAWRARADPTEAPSSDHAD